MDPLKIIEKHYNSSPLARGILITHSKLVTKKALEIARRVPELKPDLQFIKEAGMLHDIGVIFTNAPEIGCNGKSRYLCHGYLGRELLEKEGLPKHALVAERHTGVGLSAKEIEKNNLPLPKRDMLPDSIEEQIICFADCFYAKNPETLEKKFTLDTIKTKLGKFGQDKVNKFDKWCKLFKEK